MVDKNIYKTPESELISTDIPTSFNLESIKPGKLRFVGWLSLFYAIITVPLFWLSITSGATGDESLKMVTLTLQVVSVFVWIYLLFIFKHFMQLRFNLLSLGKYVYLMSGIMVILSCWPYFHTPSLDMGEISTFSIVYYALWVPYGVIVVLFGKKLLSVKERYPYLKALAWTIIISGICISSVILILVALLVGIVADILLALLFFNGRKELLKAK